MKTSGVFVLHGFRVPFAKFGEPIKLIFFGDVHRDSPNCAVSKWREFLDYAKHQKNAWFFGMGDYVELCSTSEREALLRASMHESAKTRFDDVAKGAIKQFANEVEFMRGRLVGLINGNHYWSFPDGTNSDQKLCGHLGCRYLGVSSFVRLTFEANNGHRNTLDVWAHHGAGGARLPGGSINRVDQMRDHAEADVYVMGHDHKRGVFPANPRLCIARDASHGLKLQERQAYLIRSGSFLKSYEDGQSSYNVDAARGPSSLGWAELEVTIHTRGPLVVRGIA